MNARDLLPTAGEEQFFGEVLTVADPMGWEPGIFRCGSEVVALTPLEGDPSFSELLWCWNTKCHSVRCLLVSRAGATPEREAAVLELCAHINAGLVFGCAEYIFEERTVLFKESCEFAEDTPPGMIARVTSRVRQLGAHYAGAVTATLAGTPPAVAVAEVEARGSS